MEKKYKSGVFMVKRDVQGGEMGKVDQSVGVTGYFSVLRFPLPDTENWQGILTL